MALCGANEKKEKCSENSSKNTITSEGSQHQLFDTRKMEIISKSPSILGVCFSFSEKPFGTPLCQFCLLLLHIKVQSTNLMLPLVQFRWLPFR
jgi:hypothetical protein